LVAVELPVAQEKSAHFFCEFARRRGDYAIVGLAAQAIVERDMLIDLRPVLFAVGDQPVLVNASAKLLKKTITTVLMAEVLNSLDKELDPPEDQQASSSMRRHLAKVLLARCVSALLGRPDLNAGGLR